MQYFEFGSQRCVSFATFCEGMGADHKIILFHTKSASCRKEICLVASTNSSMKWKLFSRSEKRIVWCFHTRNVSAFADVSCCFWGYQLPKFETERKLHCQLSFHVENSALEELNQTGSFSLFSHLGYSFSVILPSTFWNSVSDVKSYRGPVSFAWAGCLALD